MIDEPRFKDILEVYVRFRGALPEGAGDAGLLTRIYFGNDLVDAMDTIARQLGRAETEKQEYWEWRKKDPHGYGKAPGSP